MSEQKFVLAIDQGGQSTRVIVFDQPGRVVATRRVAVTTTAAANGFVEHDPDQLVDSARDAIAAVIGDMANSEITITAAGLATQRSTVVCWDRQSGVALSPVISWQDTRATEILQRCAPPEQIVRRITGLVRSPHYGASKLRWCLENLVAVKRAHDSGRLVMGPLSSYLLFHLVDGQPLFADPVNASRTLLWDFSTGDWSDEMLTAFGIPREALPVCVSNQHRFGTLQGTDIPLEVCTGDQSAAIFAAGDVRDGTAYINIGTGAFVLARTEQAAADSRLLRSVVWDDGNTVLRVMEGTVNGAGSAVASMGASATDISVAANGIAAPGVPLFLNGVSGLGSPYWRENFASHFIGQSDAVGKLAAVLESILFLLQVNLIQICNVSNLQSIRISGGLAHNDGVCQSLADLSGLTVMRPEQTEATARGLAFLVAGLPPDWEPETCQVFVPADDRNTLRGRFSAWLEEMTAALSEQGVVKATPPPGG